MEKDTSIINEYCEHCKNDLISACVYYIKLLLLLLLNYHKSFEQLFNC